MIAAIQSKHFAESQPTDALLTLRQGREWLQVSRSTFWKLVNEHGLPVVRIAGLVRVRERDLEAWIARHTTSNIGDRNGSDCHREILQPRL